ncbi:MAG: phosphoadenosine phosphosulfate reductase family protein [Bacillota bacterium]
MKNHIIFFSGGKSSFSVADYVKENYPNDNILLYFTDTLWENDDLYRFIYQAADKLQLPMLTHAYGLNPIQLMFEKKLVFNSRLGDCSKILKMKVARDYLRKGIVPKIEKWRNKQFLKDEDFITDATLYFGIGFEEMHREGPIRKNWKPFEVSMPLIDNVINNDEILKKHNLRQPILYDLGFSHNNCNARCVKAGQGHYKRLKEKMPDVYREILEQEYRMSYYVSAYRYITNTDLPEEDILPDHVQEILVEELEDAYRDYFYGNSERPKLFIHPAHTAIPKYSKIRKYSFMKKQENGEVKPMTISDFDKMLLEEEEEEESNKQLDLFDIGGCGCFVDFN